LKPQIVTIGVYGFSEEGFFKALQEAGVDTLCDIRRRRGVRGPLYPFANSKRLQDRLAALGIRYVHMLELAPPQEVRELQSQADEETGTGKRGRKVLSPRFAEEYKRVCLDSYDPQAFLETVGPDCKVACLFCVEGIPEACHRSLVARMLSEELGLPVRHILPPAA
jgi:uncharacterized protein (DUF488 family)